MKDMTLTEFVNVVKRAGFRDINNYPDYARILVVLATGLVTDARLLLERDDYITAIEFEHRAKRIEDYLRENGYFDFD